MFIFKAGIDFLKHVTDRDTDAADSVTLLLLLLFLFLYITSFFLINVAINSCSVSPSDYTKAAHLCVCESDCWELCQLVGSDTVLQWPL